MARRFATYDGYLQLEKILSAQDPPDFDSGDANAHRELVHHDELLFIITHQTMELWFKMIIADLAAARDLIGRPSAPGKEVPEEDIPLACTHLKRGARIFKMLAEAFGVIETMPPHHFLTFRDKLIPSSGFQSSQFRELEILAGLPESERLNYAGKPYSAALPDKDRERVEARGREMTFRKALLQWLGRTPVENAFPGFVDAFLDAYGRYIQEQRALQSDNPNITEAQAEAMDKRLDEAAEVARSFFNDAEEDVRQAHAAFVFIATYRQEPLLRWPYALIVSVLEFEEHFRIFRFRHARMVERMIGLRVGSGGSPGVEYLDQTTAEYRIFGDLLQATSFLIEQDKLPDVPNPGPLGFRFGD